MADPSKILSIYIDKADRWHDGSLFEAIVYALERADLAGATVLEGTMGFGIHRRVHRRGLFGVPDEKPIVIIVVDHEAKLRAALPSITPMVKEGLITLQDIEVVKSSAGTSAGPSNH